ncbi:MAG: DinB family protein [Bacteroidota bacterium]
MKKLILPVIILALFSFSMDTTKLTDAERTMVIGHLEKTRDHMKNVIAGLSEEQLNFRAEEDSWTIAECIEHIAVTEDAFGNLIQKTVAAGANPTMKESAQLQDDQLMEIITNRGNRVKTAEIFEPSGKFGSSNEAVKSFLDKREKHIAYVKTTDDDLRNRFSNDLPFGTVDGVQLIIFAAGHTERHVLQMEEVMAHKLFPKGK